MKDVSSKNKIVKNAIQKFIKYGGYEKVKLCERFFPKQLNQNLEGSIAVMEVMLNMTEKKIKRGGFKDKDFTATSCNKNILEESNDDIKSAVLTDALKILRCNKLIILKRENEYGEHGYTVNRVIFYKDVRFKLKQASILSDMARLMISFIRSDAKITADNFFRELDKLIGYILKLPKEHNTYSDMEFNIYKSIANGDLFDIIIKENKPLGIKPLSVNIDEDRKKLVYRSSHSALGSKKTMEVSFSDITSIKTKDKTVVENTMDIAMFSNQVQLPIIEDTTAKEIEVILAVNLIAYEYFYNIDIFETMELITDIQEIEKIYWEYGVKGNEKLYLENSSAKPSADYFLIRATDTLERITHTIGQNLQYIKVISPQIVQEEVKKNIKLFLKNSFDTFPQKPQ